MSRPACTVWLDGASMLICAAYSRTARVACGEVPTAEGDAEIGLEAVQTVHRLVVGVSGFPAVARHRVGYRCRLSAGCAGRRQVSDPVGPPVLADHARLLRRADQRQGVAGARC